MGELESGTHRLAQGPSVAQVEDACDAVDIAAAEIKACIDALARLPGVDAEKASGDARLALLRICSAVDGLRSSCQRARDSMRVQDPRFGSGRRP